MAKDKKFEAAYKLERQKRIKIRKAIRKKKSLDDRLKYGRTCPCCGQRRGNPEDDYWY